jgi:hypothetical protein
MHLSWEAITGFSISVIMFVTAVITRVISHRRDRNTPKGSSVSGASYKGVVKAG